MRSAEAREERPTRAQEAKDANESFMVWCVVGVGLWMVYRAVSPGAPATSGGRRQCGCAAGAWCVDTAGGVS